MRFVLLLLWTTSLACGGSEEAEESVVDPETVVVKTPGVGDPAKLPEVKYWAYQIQKQYENPQALVDSHYDMYVIDQVRSISDLTYYNDKLLVSKLKSSAGSKGQKKLVLAYIDIGEAEDYRWYWKKEWKVGSPAWIVTKDPDGWTGNFPVAFWKEEWKAIIWDYLDRIIADGFDGIFMDWLEACFDKDVKKAMPVGMDGGNEMAKFVEQISKYVKTKKPGFLVIGQNASALGKDPDYLKAVDAQAQEHVWLRGETGGAPGDIPIAAGDTTEYQAELAVFLKAGKPVFTVDYATKPENVKASYAQAADKKYVEYVTIVELDRLTSTPPPGY